MRRLTIALLWLYCSMNVGFAAPSTIPADSAKLEALFDQYVREYLKLNPEEASQLGLPKSGGYEYDRGGLNDGSTAGIEMGFELSQKYLSSLQAIDPNKIGKSQVVDLETLMWLLQLNFEGRQFVDDIYAIDFLTGAFPKVLNLLTEYHTIDNVEDANDYVSRIEHFPKRLADAAVLARAQDKKGSRPAIPAITWAVGAIDDFTKDSVTANLLYVDLRDKMAKAGSIDAVEAGKLLQRAATAIGQKVYPACADLRAAFTEIRQKADSIPGVWKLPNGDKYYQYALKSYTTSSLPSAQVFELGKKEVARLQSLGRVLLDSMGISGDTTFGSLMQRYWQMISTPDMKDRFTYRESPDRQQQIIKDYRAIVEKTWARLPTLFAYIPKTRVGVEPVPAYKQGSGLTYYEPASLDGKRKATFYVNMGYPPGKASMASLTYHETIPGHHFQIATQQELTSNRLYKNLFFLSGFGEGWAMYVEDLAAEQGWLPDMYSRLGEINSQLFRAVRIVVDAGMHQQRWTRERALQYMEDNLGWNSESEINRYSIWPGQACAYTMGKLRIMEMREHAKQALGSQFDLKEFHMKVLQNGSVPLDLLEGLINEYAKGDK